MRPRLVVSFRANSIFKVNSSDVPAKRVVVTKSRGKESQGIQGETKNVLRVHFTYYALHAETTLTLTKY